MFISFSVVAAAIIAALPLFRVVLFLLSLRMRILCDCFSSEMRTVSVLRRTIDRVAFARQSLSSASRRPLAELASASFPAPSLPRWLTQGGISGPFTSFKINEVIMLWSWEVRYLPANCNRDSFQCTWKVRRESEGISAMQKFNMLLFVFWITMQGIHSFVGAFCRSPCRRRRRHSPFFSGRARTVHVSPSTFPIVFITKLFIYWIQSRASTWSFIRMPECGGTRTTAESEN